MENQISKQDRAGEQRREEIIMKIKCVEKEEAKTYNKECSQKMEKRHKKKSNNCTQIVEEDTKLKLKLRKKMIKVQPHFSITKE